MHEAKDVDLQKKKNKISLQVPLSSSRELFKARVFFSTSRILSLFWSYFTNTSDSSALVLHLQRPHESNKLV